MYVTKELDFPYNESTVTPFVTTSPTAKSILVSTVLHSSVPEALIRERVQQIHRHVLTHSRYIRQADFKVIHPEALELLFAAYDKGFFDGLCQRALDEQRINFRLAPRMTSVGGTTTRFRSKNGDVSYQIAIASSILFDSFGSIKIDRPIVVTGLECGNRLGALQRIFEHELVHLIEYVCWESSNCAVARFQNIARRLFLHRARTHHLVTRREIAANSGIRLGARVTFALDGAQLTGRVIRITKRATVLVADPEGRKYSDGSRYKTYYVPIACLDPAACVSEAL
jgi:hypothetical protein